MSFVTIESAFRVSVPIHRWMQKPERRAPVRIILCLVRRSSTDDDTWQKRFTFSPVYCEVAVKRSLLSGSAALSNVRRITLMPGTMRGSSLGTISPPMCTIAFIERRSSRFCSEVLIQYLLPRHT